MVDYIKLTDWKYAITQPRNSFNCTMHATTASFRVIHHTYVSFLDTYDKQLDAQKLNITPLV